MGACKSVEEAVREAEDGYRRLVDLSPEPIFQDLKFVYVNRAALGLAASTSGKTAGR